MARRPKRALAGLGGGGKMQPGEGHGALGEALHQVLEADAKRAKRRRKRRKRAEAIPDVIEVLDIISNFLP
jgi:hypothetical protein